MTDTEFCGYDETSSLGRDLRFVRVTLSKDDELLPFLLNVKHFGSVVATKGILRGQKEESRKAYLKEIQESDLIGYDAHIIFMDIQLKLLTEFMHGEFFDLARVRGELIDTYKSWDVGALRTNVANTITQLKRFDATPMYIDAFIKSFAYKTLLRNVLQKQPGADDESVKEARHFIDGGHQFSFWGEKLITDLRDQRRLDEGFNTGIYGIANGDEYFPVIGLAGNAASILSSIPYNEEMQRYRSEPIYINFQEVENFQNEYRQNYRKDVFFQRILFLGWIDVNLQYLIPFIQYKNSGEMLHEAFRIRPPLKRFYADIGGDPRKDLVVHGEIKTEKDRLIHQECKDENLTMVHVSIFKDWVLDFLNDLSEASRDYKFEGHLKRKMQNRIGKIQTLIEKTT